MASGGRPADWTGRTGVAARLLEAVLALPVAIERIATSQLQLAGATSFTRVATIVELGGAGRVGRGEDITWSPDMQATLPAAYAARDDLAGEWSIGSLAAHLDQTGFGAAGGHPGDDKPGHHRWALESAALDLALRQQGTDLAGLLGESWHPPCVSLSMGLGTPPTADVARRWLEASPDATLKLDVSPEWSHALVAELAQLGSAVAVVDMKALYTGDWANNDYPPTLYEAIGHGLPDALIEDARLDHEVLDALDEEALGRLAWDYPITGPEDVPGIEGSTAAFSDLRPAAINVKPSRFGSLERLLGTIIRCDDEGIPCYSGGQYELGIGRTQVQSIASLCFPDAPNDCAPARFHGASPDDEGLPFGRVQVPEHVGFGWDAPTPATPLA